MGHGSQNLEDVSIAMKDFASGMEGLKTGEASKILVYPNRTR
jgi:hypothetical protein